MDILESSNRPAVAPGNMSQLPETAWTRSDLFFSGRNTEVSPLRPEQQSDKLIADVEVDGFDPLTLKSPMSMRMAQIMVPVLPFPPLQWRDTTLSLSLSPASHSLTESVSSNIISKVGTL